MSKQLPFWRRKTLSELTKSEWESLCDGCGRCCLNKFEYDDSPTVHYTDVACKLLDTDSCACTDYKNRTKHVPDCVVLSPKNIDQMDYMPPTCGYRLVSEGKDLHWWHHLKSGSRATVHEAGVSVAGRVISEEGMTDDMIETRVVRWPKFPYRGRAKPRQS